MGAAWPRTARQTLSTPQHQQEMSVPLSLTARPFPPSGITSPGLSCSSQGSHTQPLPQSVLLLCSCLPCFPSPFPEQHLGRYPLHVLVRVWGPHLQWKTHLQQKQLSWNSISDQTQVCELLRNPKVTTSSCTGSPASPPDKHLQHFSTPLLAWICLSKALTVLSNFTNNLNNL